MEVGTGRTDVAPVERTSVATAEARQVETVVIGGGQAGLAVAFHLKRLGREFVILDAEERTGDQWRRRWDSLRLFTPARFSALPGTRFPAAPHYFPTKDEYADYLERYARQFGPALRHAARVERVRRQGGGFAVTAGGSTYAAGNVVVAMATYQRPNVPAFSRDLATNIAQMHSRDYRNPAGLPAKEPVLVVGSGNSGAEISLELARSRAVYLAGRYPGHLPFDIAGLAGRMLLVRLVLRGLFHRVLTVYTPIGRKLRPKFLAGSGPLIRTKAQQLAAAGVTPVPRVAGVENGLPMLADGRVLDVGAVVWCTGYTPGFDWLDLPLEYAANEPRHARGEVEGLPGLYFVGLHFLTALSSAMVHGVGRDAERVARLIAARVATTAPASTPAARWRTPHPRA